ncbi:hypothetical protein G6F22_020969 [Rhizopus arrhizus]|nr:hypothetical protein G6F22_020969 [Rhizopus arrhizus]
MTWLDVSDTPDIVVRKFARRAAAAAESRSDRPGGTGARAALRHGNDPGAEGAGGTARLARPHADRGGRARRLRRAGDADGRADRGGRRIARAQRRPA